jgi:hypothetical protein
MFLRNKVIKLIEIYNLYSNFDKLIKFKNLNLSNILLF